MALFVKSQNLTSLLAPAIAHALKEVPDHIGDPQIEATKRSMQVVGQLTTEIEWPRLLIAVAIAFVLLGLAIWTAKTNPNISTSLMTSFQSFSGLVVGLLGGEVAATKR